MALTPKKHSVSGLLMLLLHLPLYTIHNLFVNLTRLKSRTFRRFRRQTEYRRIRL